MIEIGNIKFLEEQTTTMSMGPVGREEEENAIPFNMRQYSKSGANSFFAQDATGKGRGVRTQGYDTRRPSDRGDFGEPDDRPEDRPWNLDGFNLDDVDTYPVTIPDFTVWWEEYYMANFGDIFRSMAYLSGTNSITGLSGKFGLGINTGNPEADLEAFLNLIYMVNFFPPILDDRGNVIGGGTCLECLPDGGGIPGGIDGGGGSPGGSIGVGG